MKGHESKAIVIEETCDPLQVVASSLYSGEPIGWREVAASYSYQDVATTLKNDNPEGSGRELLSRCGRNRFEPEVTGVKPADDLGRFIVTKIERDRYRFRAAALRNVELTAPYFHSGKIWKLTEAVRIMGSSQLGYTLNKEEARTIAGFLKTLTGDQPKIEHPLLPPSSDLTPRPVLESLHPEAYQGKQPQTERH